MKVSVESMGYACKHEERVWKTLTRRPEASHIAPSSVSFVEIETMDEISLPSPRMAFKTLQPEG